jgi:hypothetical protein
MVEKPEELSDDKVFQCYFNDLMKLLLKKKKKIRNKEGKDKLGKS